MYAECIQFILLIVLSVFISLSLCLSLTLTYTDTCSADKKKAKNALKKGKIVCNKCLMLVGKSIIRRHQRSSNCNP